MHVFFCVTCDVFLHNPASNVSGMSFLCFMDFHVFQPEKHDQRDYISLVIYCFVK